MSTYRLIGFWRSEQDEKWPDPTDFVDPNWDAEERDAVVEHLGRGMTIRAWMGFSPCRLCGANNGNLDLTDGRYLWPAGVVHYVVEHDVRLPAEFVDHVLSFDEVVETDATWWLGQRHTGDG